MCFVSSVTRFPEYYPPYGQNARTEDKVKCAIIADIALGILFCVIAAIAFSGLMPLAVGLTFIVAGIVNLLMIKICGEHLLKYEKTR